MKKLNEITAGELLKELETNYNFNMVKDCVAVSFYSNHKSDGFIIGRFYSHDTIGAWLYNRTVKAFNFSVMESKTFGNKGIDIDIVLNID